jgi:hypothetical protein
MNDAELDALFRELPPPSVPAGLDEKVLQGYRRIRREEQFRRWSAPAFALAAAGIAAVYLAPAPLPVGDPSQMVARGVGERAAVLRLEMAVQQGGASERLVPGKAYPAGSTLIFKVSADEAGHWVLRRNGVVLGEGELQAGDTQLPVGYAMEAGEGPAVYEVRTEHAATEVQIPAVAP